MCCEVGNEFFSIFYMKFVLQRVGLSAMTKRLKCTAFSVVELQKFVCSDTGTEMCYTSGKCFATKFSIKWLQRTFGEVTLICCDCHLLISGC